MKALIRTIINIQFLFLLLTVNYCKPPELKVLSIELCENFSSEGVCREKLSNAHTYNIVIDRAKKFESWEALSNYMYFHSRQTPGFIVRFNRKFTLTEKEILHKTYKANYSFYGSSGHVEGLDIGEDWIGSFQYLGSVIKDRQRLFKEEKNYPKIELLFPANLKFTFESGLAKGDITTELNVNLQYKE
ncbi:MAG TPA: hypothetical protein PLX69_01260 [Leptospiraceae bacterium]|nr:hypothetical protein [Leptospiraceae bacterium]HRG73165.1 hypothetical protein [Leptospiraceae bacterium]